MIGSAGVTAAAVSGVLAAKAREDCLHYMSGYTHEDATVAGQKAYAACVQQVYLADLSQYWLLKPAVVTLLLAFFCTLFVLAYRTLKRHRTGAELKLEDAVLWLVFVMLCTVGAELVLLLLYKSIRFVFNL